MTNQKCLGGCTKVAKVAGVATADERIGENLQALRGSMSQAALAAQMKKRGWRWSQPTVAAVEKGERPLKLAEAEHLVEILGLAEIEELTERPFRTLADNAWGRMVRASDALRLAAVEFWESQRHLAALADESAAWANDDDVKIWTLWLLSDEADPVHIVETTSPRVPILPETVDANPDFAATHWWTRKLALGPYGEHSRRSPSSRNQQG